jgi:signal transduction histidine kinase
MIEMLGEPPYLHSRGSAGESLCLIAMQAAHRSAAFRRIIQRDLPSLSAALDRIRRSPSPAPEFLPFPARLTIILFLPNPPSEEDLRQGVSLAELVSQIDGLSNLLETPVSLEIYDRPRLVEILRSNPQIAARYFDLTTGALIGSTEEYSQESQTGDDEAPLSDEGLNPLQEQLNHERRLRIEAEREAAWKDVAFTAAHKLGNPVFAIETNLQELIDETASSDKIVHDIIHDISISVEKAKTIIEQFKSLTRFRNISPRPVDIVPLIRTSCAPARAMGIKTRVSAPRETVLLLVIRR